MPKIIVPGVHDLIEAPVAYNLETNQLQPDDTMFIYLPSKWAPLGSRLYPFSGLRFMTPGELSSARYRIDAGGWNSIVVGSYTDLLQAILYTSSQVTTYDSWSYELELTDTQSNVQSVLIDINSSVLLGPSKNAAKSAGFRPFSDSVLGDPTYIQSVAYSVDGPVTVGKTSITADVIFSGTHTGGDDEDDLDDSTADFDNTSIRLNLDIVKNITDSSQAVITATNGSKIVGALSGGTDNNWDNGDSYQVGDGDTLDLIAKKFELSLATAGFYTVWLYVTDTSANEVNAGVGVFIDG